MGVTEHGVWRGMLWVSLCPWQSPQQKMGFLFPCRSKWKVGWLGWPRSGNLLLSLHEVQGASVEVLSVGKV